MGTGTNRRWRTILRPIGPAAVARSLAIAGLLSIPLASPAAAQSTAADDPFAGVEEMVVTGSAAALLAPASTSAISFDTESLVEIGAQDLGDLDDYVPNLNIATVNATNASFFIRGVGLQDFGANASSSVPIFQNGISRNASATQLVGLFDIGELTVLKGPQGSGNFRNASAGSFVFKAVAPEPEYTAAARVTTAKLVSVDARDASRFGFEGAMSAPIYEDIVSARVAARYTHENPFWLNRCANRLPIADRPTQGPFDSVGLCGELVANGSRSEVVPFLPRYVGEVDDYGFRGQVRIKPPDVPIDWTFLVEISNLNRDSTTGQHVGTGIGLLGQGDRSNYRDLDLSNREAFLVADFRAKNPTLPIAQVQGLARERLAKEVRKRPLDRGPYAGALDRPGRTLLETHTASTTAVIEADAAVTTINFGFVDYRKSEARDTDISPNQKFGSKGDDQAWELYGDLSVKGESIGALPIGWDTGLFTIYEKMEAFQQQDLGSFTNGGQRNLTSYTQQLFGWGTYMEGSYELVEGLIFSAGLRYNWERKDFEVDNTRQTLLPFFTPPLLITTNERSSNQRTWDGVTGFANVEYSFTEEVSTYLKYTRGFKAGHFNPSDATAAKVPGEGFADPETLDSVEWGVSGAAWAGRLRGTGAFFFYNYENYQVFRLTTNFQGVSRVVQNAKQARNFGAEVELTLTPLQGYAPEAIEGLSATLRGGWLEAEFVEFTVTEQRIIDGSSFGIPIDFSGNPLLNTQNLTLTGLFAWPIVTERFGTLTAGYDFSWSDDTTFDPNQGRGETNTLGGNNFPPYTVGNRAYILHNVRLSWKPPGDTGMEFAGWCRNLTDERYLTFSVDLSTFSTQLLNYVADPRVCGADIRFSW